MAITVTKKSMVRQEKIPCVLMRGGTSKGLYFINTDLPSDPEERDRALLKIMGSPHPMQIDGVGGGQPQTSKVAIISLSDRDDADIDYLFAQVIVNEARVDTSPNCGNMLSGVAPFAIESGLFPACNGSTVVRVFNVNTGTIIHSEVQTPFGAVTYEGEQRIDGVDGTAAPVYLHFMNSEGAKTGQFFPTGHVREFIDDTEVTLIDYSVPMMLLLAKDLGLQGTEAPEKIDENDVLLKKIEKMRIEAGQRMGLGDVSNKVIPKVGILSPATKGGTLTSRYLMPHSCHKSHAITGAMCIASACYVNNTVASELIGGEFDKDKTIIIEHPTGAVDLSVKLKNKKIESIAVIRTTRRLFEGKVLI